jgi:hypothetical protein
MSRRPQLNRYLIDGKATASDLSVDEGELCSSLAAGFRRTG